MKKFFTVQRTSTWAAVAISDVTEKTEVQRCRSDIFD